MTTDRDRLVRAAELHGPLYYELFMLQGAASGILEARLRRLQQGDSFALRVQENALLESALIHARSLNDFLIRPIPVNPPPWHADIRRTDFAPDWTPQPTEIVDSLSKHDFVGISQLLAHLTWHRLDDNVSWYYDAIARDLFAVADAWAWHVGQSDQHLGELVADTVTAARNAA